MKTSAVACVEHLVEEYRRFLRTSYRFLDRQLREQFEAYVQGTDVVVRGPYVTLSRDFERGNTLAKLVEAGKADRELLRFRWPFGGEALYRHQEESLESGRAGRPFIVTTGTGSGKTEAFLLPVIDGVLQRKRQGVQGVQAILLYPMNALANDQLERLRRLVRGSGVDLSFALYTGDSDASSKSLREEPAETERTTRPAIRKSPPDILLTNYKQLEFLLVRAEDRILFTRALRFLVLDELHSYRGALSTEIACLIRRLKAHAGIEPGELLGIGTSATVASGAGGVEALAEFASILYGEEFRPADIIGESLVPPTIESEPWVPAVPGLGGTLVDLDPADEPAMVSFAERLTGRRCAVGGTLAGRIGGVLKGNALVGLLEQTFSRPASLQDAVVEVQGRFADRAAQAKESVQREIEAYLFAGSLGDENDPPRLRPKLHLFFHGVYDVSLCLNPECRRLVPQGGTECLACGSAARPAALCRTCGQDFVKVRFENEEDLLPVGTGDFYSDERTAFLTPKVHLLPERVGEEEAEVANAETEPGTEALKGKPKKQEDALKPVSVCVTCGRVLPEGSDCPVCKRPGASYLQFRWRNKVPPKAGVLHTCPACGDTYTKADIVTPLRTGTASTVSAIVTHHLDFLENADRKLLVFADNRQDAAHQAGYTADKHRSFALRHLVAHEVKAAGPDGVYLSELPQRLFDWYRKLGIIQGRPTKPEVRRWLDAITYELASEVTRFTRQRASLENLGLIGVEYEFLDELTRDPAFEAAVGGAGVDAVTGTVLVRAILDLMRRNRALAYDFFQEYIDPERKRRYRELEGDPYGVRFPDWGRGPNGYALDRPDHIRKSKSGSILGFYQENPSAGRLTATQTLASRLTGDRASAEQFLKLVVPILLRLELLVPVPNFPIPKTDAVSKLRVLQVNPKVIRLVQPVEGFRCNACQTWRPYSLPFCPTSKCAGGKLQKASVDHENYYVRLYTDRHPQRLTISEHSAQIGGEERARRETAFKDGKLDALVCTPTLELGVDIGPLLTVTLRNAPPTPANYVQRVGRAGRRLRIGFVSTFCAGGAHDRHAFEHPEWLVSGNFMPPTLRLDNPRIVHRHLRSFLLESIDSQLPRLMGELLDDIRTPTRWNPETLKVMFDEVGGRRPELAARLARLFEADRRAGRTERYGTSEARTLVEGFEKDVVREFDAWWERVRQLDKEFNEFSTVGSPRQDDKKAAARKRAYHEITKDPERAYTLDYLATRGLLPAYQFPVDTFSLDPGVVDTPTLYRSAAIAIEEFAPGNFVYANGHKLRSIRVLFAGGPGSEPGRRTRSDAETAGRLKQFWFCRKCDEVSDQVFNTCPRCGATGPEAIESVFVDAFEAEEALRIGSDEESRQKQYHLRRESLLSADEGHCLLFPYPSAPVEYRKLGEILVTNWGKADSKTGEGARFWLCPECGRHRPQDPANPAHAKPIQDWNDKHRRACSGEPVWLVLGYQFQADCLVLSYPNPQDRERIGKTELSPTLVTLAEALLVGAADLLELENSELAAFPRRSPFGKDTEEIVLYETVAGGAGYVEQLARRLPEVALAARERLYEHQCLRGCYLCLKHYRNQRWHHFFDKDRIRDLLLTLSMMDPVEPTQGKAGVGADVLRRFLDERRGELDSSGKRPGVKGPQSPIEARLLEALQQIPGLPTPELQYEIRNGDRLVTVPDFAYPDARIAVFCDGFAFHGNPDTLELDAKKRNWLQSREGGSWVVLTYWGRTIMRKAEACVREIADLYRQRTERMGSSSGKSERMQPHIR